MRNFSQTFSHESRALKAHTFFIIGLKLIMLMSFSFAKRAVMAMNFFKKGG